MGDFTSKVILLISAIALLSCKTSTRTFSVNNDTGNDTLCMQNATQPCKSLTVLSDRLLHAKNIHITVETNITLSGLLTIKCSQNITICSSKTTVRVISCSPNNSGFMLYKVSGFTISNLELHKCGKKHGKSEFHYHAAMLFVNCSQLRIEGVLYSHCKYTALALLECHGNVTIHAAHFIKNGVQEDRNKELEHSYAAAISIETGKNMEPVNYSIGECQFIKNVAPSRKKSKKACSGRDRGGGALAIVMETDEKRAHSGKSIISVTNCNFFGNEGKTWGGAIYAHYQNRNRKNAIQITIEISIMRCNFSENRATRGGAIYVHYRDRIKNSSFKISSSIFRNNSANKIGGGVNIGYLTKHCHKNKVHLTDCHFISNQATFGGGLALFSQYFEKPCKENVVTIVNSTWKNNTACLGAAVDLTPWDTKQNPSGFLPVPIFRNCTFIENKLIHIHGPNCDYNSEVNCYQPTITSGVFIITRFEVHFDSHIRFIRNHYTALYMLSGVLQLNRSSILEFESNRGYKGGAVALYSFSSIVLCKNSLLNFTNNHAIIYGGGIYHHTMNQHDFFNASNKDCSTTNNCFIRADSSHHNPNEQRAVFRGNTAGVRGKSVYSESFMQCIRNCGTHTLNSTFNCVANFTFDDQQNALASSGAMFKLSSYEFSVIPGSTLQIPLSIHDDFGHPIEQLVHVQEAGNDGRNTSIQHSYTMTGEIVPLGQPYSCLNLTASVVGIRQFTLPFNVTLQDCPPGYHFKESSCTCASGKKGYGIVLKCSPGYHAHIRSGFWVGYIPESSSAPTSLFYAPCSSTMCKNRAHLLPNSSQDLNKSICKHNRTGILCGRCANNKSVYYNSRDFSCGNNQYCKYGLLFYLLSEILPMVVFFLVVITFDISFTSGSMVGFIFFSQHLSPLEIIEATPAFQYLQTPYQLVYGLFNFEYFGIEKLSFCLARDFQALDIIAFKYVTVLIAFGLVLILIGVARNNACKRLFRLRRRISSKTSLVNGLSAFLVTCYAQCTKTSFFILKYTTPVGYNGKLEKHYSYYGALVYFSSSHLVYAGPALFSLIVITTLPPLVLLLHPLSLQFLSLCGLSEHWVINKALQFTCINKLMPLIDCFQGCYKNKLRFFAGLYFLYRVAILLCFLFIEESTDFRLYSIGILILILGVHSMAKPYKKQLHNTVESLILLNLAMINVCSNLANHSTGKQETSYEYTTSMVTMIFASIQLVLIYLPLLVAVVVLLYQAGKRLCHSFQLNATPNQEEMCENDLQPNRGCVRTSYETIN